MKQTTFASAAWDRKGKVTRRERFLAEMDQVIPWGSILGLIEPHYPKAGDGTQPMPMEQMLRIYFMQQWFNLSDPAMEDSLYDSESMRRIHNSRLNVRSRSKAVLRVIGASAQVLVTTHDVELQHLLGVQFELFHFQENPAVEGFFDHELHSGASTQRNAIRVLERLGYPASIITEALATVIAIDAPKMPSADMAPPSRNRSNGPGEA